MVGRGKDGRGPTMVTQATSNTFALTEQMRRETARTVDRLLRSRDVVLGRNEPDVGLTSDCSAPAISMIEAASSCADRERMEKRETDAIDASASPRNPIVAMA